MAAISATLLQTLREDLNEAIKAVGEKHGVALKVGSASYSGNNATFKMDVAGIVGGTVVTKQVQDFLSYVGIHGFAKDDLGKTFTYGGCSYAVAGYAPRKRLSLLATRTTDGKTFCFPCDAIHKLIEGVR